LLANLALNAASAQARWPGWLDLVRVYAWLALAIFAAALVYFTWRQAQPKKSKKRDPRKVAELLAEAVNAQWVSETKRRRVFNPYALPVQWAAADPDLFTRGQSLSSKRQEAPAVHPNWRSPGLLILCNWLAVTRNWLTCSGGYPLACSLF
jgi:hypothetical protein